MGVRVYCLSRQAVICLLSTGSHLMMSIFKHLDILGIFVVMDMNSFCRSNSNHCNGIPWIQLHYHGIPFKRMVAHYLLVLVQLCI